MSEWWAGLGLEQQFYYGAAIIATAVLLLQTLLMLIGAGADELVDAGDVDLDGPDDHPSGIHLLSSRTLVAFFTGFGWTGAMRAAEGASTMVTLLAATGVGLGFGYVVFRLMGALHRLRHSGTLDYKNALGEVGSVYLEVHPEMAAGGQIQVQVQGRLKVVQALTRGAAIARGDRVRVVDLLDRNTLVVEPVAGAGQED